MCLDEQDQKELEKPTKNEDSIVLYIFKKIVLSLFSVKLWAYFLCFFFCCWMLYSEKMTGEVFSNTILSLYGLTFALREYSKSQANKN